MTRLLLLLACTGPTDATPDPAPAAAAQAEAPVTFPPALAGSWSASGQGPTSPDGTPGMSWVVELELGGTRYLRTGYPHWEETATVTRIEQEGTTYILHVTEHVRNEAALPDGSISLVLSTDGKNLTLENWTLSR